MALPTARETGQNGAMSEITIRPARPADASAIARLDVETWRTTYAGVLSASYLVGLSERRREAGWRSVILREPRDVRVATDATGAILGFGSCGPNRGDRFETPLRLVLGHFFNHQTHHRGQVHGLLSQTGVAPPPIDLIDFILREKAAETAGSSG